MTVSFRLFGHIGQIQQSRGIIIDTRFKRGRLHEDIEILFSGKEILYK